MRSLVLVCLLTVPLPAFAAPATWIDFMFETTYGDFKFGSERNTAYVEDLALGDQGEDFLETGTQTFLIVSGDVQLETGPLLDVTPHPHVGAVYSYAGGGRVAVVFDLALPGGGFHSGTFEASLGPYEIRGDAEGLMGPGLFDRGTARLLGINRHTSFGYATLYLDHTDEYPEPFRLARAYGQWNIAAQVPEPSTLATGVLGAVFLFARRRALL